jgi:hypothetical protein
VLLTLAFAALLLAGLALRFWLATRQVRHVARHRSAVPAAFAGRIPLAAWTCSTAPCWNGWAAACCSSWRCWAPSR